MLILCEPFCLADIPGHRKNCTTSLVFDHSGILEIIYIYFTMILCVTTFVDNEISQRHKIPILCYGSHDLSKSDYAILSRYRMKYPIMNCVYFQNFKPLVVQDSLCPVRLETQTAGFLTHRLI